jgi:LmbE family N-acetylglucosaminyl deacetylase
VDTHSHSTPRTLLAVFAHPDDETFGPGGTLARYAATGVDVHYLCATRGDVGEVDAALMSQNGHASAADLRTAELMCASQILGLAGVEFLDYRDSGMEGSPENLHPQSLYQADRVRLAGEVTAVIRQLQPQVVITFDPFGGYGHPDHIAIHYATLAAFFAAGDARRFPEQLAAGLPLYQPARLYYSTFDKRALRWLIRLMPLAGKNPRAFGTNQDIDLVEIASWHVPITTRIDVGRYLDTKWRAAACHASQGGGSGLWGILPLPIRRRLLASETFSRVYPRPGPALEKDLFAGL